MAVAFDAVGPSSSGTTGASSPLTWTHVCGASATHLLVGATWDGSPDTGQTMAATYNGVSMTSLGVWHTGGGTAGFLQVWSLASPTAGSHSVSVTATGTPGGLNGGSVSFTGSATLSAVQTFVTSGAAANPSLTFTGSVSGNMVAAFVGGGSPQTLTGSFTSRYQENAGSGQQGAGYTGCATIASPGGSATASWTAASDFYAIAAVEVQAGGSQAAAALMPAPWARPWRPQMSRRFGPAMPFTGPPLMQPPVTLQATAALSGSGTLTAAPVPFITGLGGTGAGYFADQLGRPRMVLGDAVWGLPGNVGRWSSGAWQSDYDTYFATRGSQGFTVAYCKPMGTVQSGNIDNNGGTFDGLFPFQGGAGANPSTGLTSSYWARIDYMLASAANQGITIFLNAIGYNSDFTTTGPLSGKSAAEFQSYGAQLGARYAATPNLIWMVADDYFGGSDTLISGFLTGLRGAGDTHPITIENYPETTSRFDPSTSTALPWGTANGQFNFCYSYNVTYWMIEKAYLEASPITVIQGDGYFYQGGSTYAGGSGAFAYDRAVRQDAWMALSSGARGIILGDEACWQWQSVAQAAAASNWYQKNNAGNIRALIESLPNWQNLIPDTSSALVTAGRGTHASGFASGGGGGQYEVAFTDSYVTASRTAAGDLAVIYLSHATSITIDQSQLVAGYAAFWVDPITGAKTSTATGTTYNSATPGNNSQGDPDWVLVFQTASTPAGTASLSGTGSLTASPQLAGTAALSGLGSLTASPQLAGTASLSGTGSLTAAPQLAGTASLSGLGTLSVSGVTLGTSATLSGLGTLTASPGAQATASLSGLGTLTASPVLTGSASLSGLGSLTAGPALQGAVSLSGAGTLSAAPALAGAASLSGTGTLSAVWALSETLTLSGSGTLSFSQGQGSATLTGAGTLTASPALAAAAALTGTGTLTAASTQTLATAAALSGQGTLSAVLRLTGTAALSGTGTLSVPGTPPAGHGDAFFAFFP